ncbi:hypothetical protein PR003_g3421 [Phytophthora rubi]|uniref:RxLR effector protein n=2 Tax=Phytophthora TaxID=4783 RepID=A0A6A4G122_9STRA|nr:hypothetical protein PR002_g3275 [Phytophthora rubi]KAE9352683.1 hypothetical protein PF008_g5359 [Phytophthora fragariae]KAE9354315.1 hypothetical protein PR003_g3421 [Phytophthora rubi]
MNYALHFANLFLFLLNFASTSRTTPGKGVVHLAVKPKDGDNSDVMLSKARPPVEHGAKVGRNHRSDGLLDSLGRGSEVL